MQFAIDIINQKKFEKVKKEAEEYYKNIGEIYCPYFQNKVIYYKFIAVIKKRVLKYMKKNLLKFGLYFLISLALTVYLYWPLFQKIKIDNSKSDLDNTLNKLDLNLTEEIKEILDRTIYLSKNSHKLCLKNKNKIYLIHKDSYMPKMPFIFKTDDISQEKFFQDNKIGAMAINLYYNDNLEKNYLYREIRKEKDCVILDRTRLQNFASSTIEYHHLTGLNSLNELDFGNQYKLQITRQILGSSIIDTTNSSVFIVARWHFFILTLGGIFLIIRLFSKNK